MAERTDLSLYLVTDSTPELLRGRDICAVVDEALQGGEATQHLQLLLLRLHVLIYLSL